MNRMKWTTQQNEWLIERMFNRGNEELRKMFNELFKTNVSKNAFGCKRYRTKRVFAQKLAAKKESLRVERRTDELLRGNNKWWSIPDGAPYMMISLTRNGVGTMDMTDRLGVNPAYAMLVRSKRLIDRCPKEHETGPMIVRGKDLLLLERIPPMPDEDIIEKLAKSGLYLTGEVHCCSSDNRDFTDDRWYLGMSGEFCSRGWKSSTANREEYGGHRWTLTNVAPAPRPKRTEEESVASLETATNERFALMKSGKAPWWIDKDGMPRYVAKGYPTFAVDTDSPQDSVLMKLTIANGGGGSMFVGEEIMTLEQIPNKPTDEQIHKAEKAGFRLLEMVACFYNKADPYKSEYYFGLSGKVFRHIDSDEITEDEFNGLRWVADRIEKNDILIVDTIRPIDGPNINRRIRKLCESLKIKTLGDLTERDEADLLMVTGVGYKTVEIITSILKSHGLQLKTT
jgi:hypothetical protein